VESSRRGEAAPRGSRRGARQAGGGGGAGEGGGGGGGGQGKVVARVAVVARGVRRGDARGVHLLDVMQLSVEVVLLFIYVVLEQLLIRPPPVH
jgi:hypothetical protein